MQNENSKEITAVKAVWISGLNLHRFWQSYSFVSSILNYQIEKLYQKLERAGRVSSGISTLEVG